MDKVPPTLPPGGIILGQTQPQQIKRTKTTVEFHSSMIGIYAMLNEENVCTGYRIQIIDPIFNVEYRFDIDYQPTWDDVMSGIPQFPKIGEKADVGEEKADTNGK